MSKTDYKPSKWYWHEALDRSSLACDFFHDNVEQHPAVQNSKALKEKAEAITTAMADFYQEVGRESCAFGMLDKNNPLPDTQEQGWLPIETAPKDGTEILVRIPLNWAEKNQEDARVGRGYFVQAMWFVFGFGSRRNLWLNRLDNWVMETTPTHWIPLPSPPQENKP